MSVKSDLNAGTDKRTSMTNALPDHAGYLSHLNRKQREEAKAL